MTLDELKARIVAFGADVAALQRLSAELDKAKALLDEVEKRIADVARPAKRSDLYAKLRKYETGYSDLPACLSNGHVRNPSAARTALAMQAREL